MAKHILHTTIQVRRGTTAEWDAVKTTAVPAAGEPCLNTETHVVVYGDGTSTYEQLIKQYEEDNKLSDLLNPEESGGSGLETTPDGKLSLEGLTDAPANSAPFTDGEGNITWKELYSKDEIDDKLTQAFKYQGTVADKSELEAKQGTAQNGDVWYQEDEDEFYIWNGIKFESFGSLTNFASASQVEDLENRVQTLENKETEIESKTIEIIKLAGTPLEVSPDDHSVDIPIATAEKVGIVKSTDVINGVAVAEDGTMSVNQLDVKKLTQLIGDELILDGGQAGENLLVSSADVDNIMDDMFDGLNTALSADHLSFTKCANGTVFGTVAADAGEATVDSIVTSVANVITAKLQSLSDKVEKLTAGSVDLPISESNNLLKLYAFVKAAFGDTVHRSTKLTELVGKSITIKFTTKESKEFDRTISFIGGAVGEKAMTVRAQGDTIADELKGSDLMGTDFAIKFNGALGKATGSVKKVSTLSLFPGVTDGHYIAFQMTGQYPGKELKLVSSSEEEKTVSADDRDFVIRVDKYKSLKKNVKVKADGIVVVEIDVTGVTLK